MSNTNEPSKLNANYNSLVGGITEAAGQALGNKDLQSSGSKQKTQGDTEYKAAQAKEWGEGAADEVTGKVNNVIGAVTGDSTKQAEGQVRHEAGAAQRKLNE